MTPSHVHVLGFSALGLSTGDSGCLSPSHSLLLRFFSCQVKSVSHDLEQLHRLLQVARSLLRNPHLCLGPYVRSLVGSVLYCVLEPLAASINPLNDHWTLRDGAALLLSHIFW